MEKFFLTKEYLTASNCPSLEFAIHWSDEKPASNTILEFITCSFKKGYLLNSYSFIRNAMMCTDICQCKSFGNISAKTNYDHNCNK